MNKLSNKKIFNKFLISLFVLFVLSNCAYSINLEYKNSLSKVELARVSDDSYTINLYTSKKYLDPVKVIKKNDLSYYILLPETKNASSVVNAQSSDIRNVTTNSYPYAGQDVNNGYTKINITTTRPVNFNINIKNSFSESVSKNTSQTKIAKAPLPTETQVQKKNLQNFQPVKVEESVQKISKKPEIIQKKEEPKTKKITQNTKPKNETKTIEPKPVLQKAILDNKTTKQIEDIKPEQENKQVEEKFTTEELDNDFDSALNVAPEVVEDVEFDSSYREKISLFSKAKRKTSRILNKIDSVLADSNVTLANILCMLISGIVVFFVALFALTRKQKPNPKLKSKYELQDKKVQPKKTKKTTNNGQYFVFDKNVRQTVFSDPTSSAIKRNYELSSYDPELNNYEKFNKTRQKETSKQSDYDIIQKILREDNIIDVSSGEYDVIDNTIGAKQPKKEREILTKQMEKEEVNLKQPDIVTSPIVKEEMKVELQNEPIVLSKVEIAPEKGFMCVSYNENISLVGYIFDDVFALYNFKCPKLENYEIKYRMTDKDEFGTNFIVKVENIKVLVNVAKSSMKLQVVM